MTKPLDNIEHSGEIISIENNSIKVLITQHSACSSCHSKSHCSMSEMEEKIIEIPIYENHNYQLGDHVVVQMEKSAGLKAVFYAYLLPFLVILISLIIFTNLISSQGIAGLLALTILAPYYIILSRFKDKIKKEFHFRIK